MTLKTAINGSRGFDCNQQLSGAHAQAFKASGMDFCIRYLPRTPALIPGNLTAMELEILLTAGLDVGFVQHVALPNWTPSAGLGASYGQYAAVYASSIGIPAGAVLWCDLEEVAPGTAASHVIEYCTAWFNSVKVGGFVPGLYVGWGVVLSDQQLWELPVKNYWRSYNCDQDIPTRGFQLIQSTAKTLDGVAYDPNYAVADKLGGLPVWVSA